MHKIFWSMCFALYWLLHQWLLLLTWCNFRSSMYNMYYSQYDVWDEIAYSLVNLNGTIGEV